MNDGAASLSDADIPTRREFGLSFTGGTAYFPLMPRVLSLTLGMGRIRLK